MINQNLHEKNRYDDVTFPFGMYTVTKQDVFPVGRGYLDLHWHEELQFTYVQSGRVSMKIADSNYDLNEGQAIFINSGMLHITTSMSDDAKYISVNFPSKLLTFFEGSAMERRYVRPYVANFNLPAVAIEGNEDWHHDFIISLRKIIKELKQTKYFGQEYHLSIEAAKLWLILVENTKLADQVTSNAWIKQQQRMRSMMIYIQEHYHQELLLEDIAGSAHISIGECGRCFKNMIGMTPMAYLLDYRINKSIELIETTGYTISEIASKVGFNHFSYYIQCFKKKTGFTPKQFQKMTEGKDNEKT